MDIITTLTAGYTKCSWLQNVLDLWGEQPSMGEGLTSPECMNQALALHAYGTLQ